jgi:L-serine dehydratase
MYCKVSELVDAAELAGIAISEVMIQQEMASFGRTREEIFGDVERNLAVMEAAANRGMAEDIRSVSGLTGGDARRLRTYLSMGSFLSGRTVLESVCCALATNEVNAAMGTVCATPTAGASGVVPGTLLALKDKLNPSREQMLRFLFTAGAFGLAVANGATISGAEGGCQAEVGSATGMAAAAIVEMAGGTPQQSAHAMALALAGIESRIPCDEVIGALFEVGQALPATLRETGQGGLANTPTGRRMESQVFASTRDDSSDSY